MHLTSILLGALASSAAMARSIPKLQIRQIPGLNEVQSRNAEAAIGEVRAWGLNRHACITVIATALQESELQIYANPVVPESMNYPHDIVGGDQDSVGTSYTTPYGTIAAFLFK